MSDTPFLPLDSTDALDAALARSDETPVVVFKHSTACPVSSRAHDRMAALAEANDAPPVYRVVVQTHRPVSNAVAERLGVTHETPQAIVVRGGAAAFEASHHRVTAAAVRDALAEASAA
jgi:bacillithiol system protein YtxJ